MAINDVVRLRVQARFSRVLAKLASSAYVNGANSILAVEPAQANKYGNRDGYRSTSTGGAGTQAEAFTPPWAVGAGNWTWATLDSYRVFSTGPVVVRAAYQFGTVNGGVFTPTSTTADATFQSSALPTTGLAINPFAAGVQAPAGTTHARLRLRVNDADGVDLGHSVYNNLRPYIGSTKAAVEAAAGPIETLTGRTISLSTNRGVSLQNGLEVVEPGVLSGVVRGAELSPSVNAAMQPGAKLTLEGWDEVSAAWTTVFTGTLTESDATYNRDGTADVKIAATDNVTALAATPAAEAFDVVADPRPGGTTSGLWTEKYDKLMKDYGAAFAYDGATVFTPGYVKPLSVLPNGNLLQQLTLLRNSLWGLGLFVNRAGRVVMRDVAGEVGAGAGAVMTFSDRFLNHFGAPRPTGYDLGEGAGPKYARTRWWGPNGNGEYQVVSTDLLPKEMGGQVGTILRKKWTVAGNAGDTGFDHSMATLAVRPGETFTTSHFMRAYQANPHGDMHAAIAYYWINAANEVVSRTFGKIFYLPQTGNWEDRWLRVWDTTTVPEGLGIVGVQAIGDILGTSAQHQAQDSIDIVGGNHTFTDKLLPFIPHSLDTAGAGYYTDISLGFSPKLNINVVNINKANRDVEKVYGPYLNEPSRALNSENDMTVEVNAGQPDLLAEKYLGEFAGVGRTVDTLDLNLTDKRGRVLGLDVYSAVRVRHEATAYGAAAVGEPNDGRSLVLGVEHTITAKRWTTRLRLRPPRVSRPVAMTYPPLGPGTGPDDLGENAGFGRVMGEAFLGRSEKVGFGGMGSVPNAYANWILAEWTDMVTPANARACEVTYDWNARSNQNQAADYYIDARINGGAWIQLVHIYRHNNTDAGQALGGPLTCWVDFRPGDDVDTRLRMSNGGGGLETRVGLVCAYATFFK